MSRIRARISGMDCGSCALTIEDGVRKLGGVREVTVDFTTETITVEGEPDRGELARRISQLGYRLEELGSHTAAHEASPAAIGEHGAPGFVRFLLTQPRLRIAGLAALALLASLPFDVPFVAALVAIVVGAPVLLKGVRALVFSRRVTIDLLMAIASVGALAIDAAGEAAAVMLLYTLGEALEAYSAERARDSLRSLLALQPQMATRLERHGDEDEHSHDACEQDHDHDHGRENAHEHEHSHVRACDSEHEHDRDAGHAHRRDHEHGPDDACDHEHGRAKAHATAAKARQEPHLHHRRIPLAEVRVGDHLLVRPGERVPVDGRVLDGESELDESAITGESLPVRRASGDAVLGGTLNGSGAIIVEALRPAADSTIARIAALVEQARAQRSPVERYIDRFARLYTPAIVLLALAVVLVPVLAFGAPLLDAADGERGWLYRGLALLIVACPCALVISIPVTAVSALTRLAQLGVLVRGGAQLDALADLRALAFDKTGTLTRGRPAVTALQGADCAHQASMGAECSGCDELLATAAAVESRSEHPISHAILAAADRRGVQRRYAPAEGVQAIAGRGIVGRLAGVPVAVGSDALFAADGAHTLELPPAFARDVRDSHRTVMFVARDRRLLGAIGVEDDLREGTREALAALRSASPPVYAVMLTGDNPRVAQRIADAAGNIAQVRAGLLPERKLRAIEDLKIEYGTVGMVGDGINDAPALARADVGIAMGGGGSAQAMETADVVLMQDDLRRVPRAIALARRTRALIKQNIALSLGLKLAFVVLAVPGWATLWVAVAADVGATLLVTLNGMRLLRS